MNEEQEKAVKTLKSALNKCAKANLSGGVFDTHFCVWPSDRDPEQDALDEIYHSFFFAVEEYGEIITSKMKLDGGAGV